MIAICISLLWAGPLFGQLTWYLATPAAEWAPRELHAGAVFDSAIWVLYGRGPGVKDVWKSKDGTEWIQTYTASGYGNDQAAVVYDGKLWLMGGYEDARYSNDVYNSTDGRTWTKVGTIPPMWSTRIGHRALVHDGKIWVLGGYAYPGYTPLNDVWCTTDGRTWTMVTASAPWSPRFWHAATVYGNKMWVLGGCDPSDLNDVWYSSDGVNWTQATAAAGWARRHLHAAVAYDRKLWVLGGYTGSHKNDVWYSSDGIGWTMVPPTQQIWYPRLGHTALVFDGKIWVMGGQIAHNNFLNDVWYAVPTTGLEEEKVVADKSLSARLQIAPNPVTQGRVTVRVSGLGQDSPVTVRVFDIGGRCVRSEVHNAECGASGVMLDLHGLVSGTYLLRVNAPGYSESRTLVIRK